MSVCFYRYARKLERHAEEIERQPSAHADPGSAATSKRLRGLAQELKSDSGPCPYYPSCGCDEGLSPGCCRRG